MAVRGLVVTEKVGRVRTCKIGLRRLEEEAAWLESYRQLRDARFDADDGRILWWCVVKRQTEDRLAHAVRLQRVQVPPR